MSAAILRRQILATPDDTTLRLVYADALDEEAGEGNVNAELARIIRSMGSIGDYVVPRPSHIWSHFYVPYWNDLSEDGLEVGLGKDQSEWVASIRGKALHEMVIRNGFIEELSTITYYWSYEAERLLERWPIRSVTIVGNPDFQIRNDRRIIVHIAEKRVEATLSPHRASRSFHVAAAREIYAGQWPGVKFIWR